MKKQNQEKSMLPLFLKFIKAAKSGKRRQPNGRKITVGTLQNYVYTYKVLEKFAAGKNFILRVNEIRSADKRKLAKEKRYWEKFKRQFLNYCYDDCSYSDNYVGLLVKTLKSFLNYLKEYQLMNIGTFYKMFYAPSEEKPVIALLPEELNMLIYDKAIEEKLPNRLREIKDFFVFGCTVGLRFSDLIALKVQNIRRSKTEWFLNTRSRKTRIETSLKLPLYAIEIIERYRKYRPYLLPRFNNVNFNVYVKEMAEIAGLTSNMNVIRERAGKVIKANTQRRLCELITSHTMRKTAITVMLSLGVPEAVVRKISGHRAMSKEFFRYVSVAQVYQDKETEKMFQKLSALNTASE